MATLFIWRSTAADPVSSAVATSPWVGTGVLFAFQLYATVSACLTVAAFTLPGLADGSPALAVSAPSTAPATARAAPSTGQPAALPSSAKELCPKPTGLLQEQCQSFIFPREAESASGNVPADDDEPLTPIDMESVYGLPDPSSSKGSGETVAIVDAFGDDYAESDLNAYREPYGLPACTTDNGCLHIYNETGGTSLPAGPDRRQHRLANRDRSGPGHGLDGLSELPHRPIRGQLGQPGRPRHRGEQRGRPWRQVHFQQLVRQ